MTALLGLATGSSEATPRDVDYLQQIKPLLAEKCAACHGALKQNAGLRLDVGRFILKGGDEGPVVEPGSSRLSRLIERVSNDDVDLRMPPRGEGEPLNAQQIALLSAWIDGGAAIPADEPVPADPLDHWAFQTPVRPPVPDVEDADISNPIDAFLLTEQRHIGIAPMGRAEKATLLRRAYFNLVGLPPTIEAQQSFFNDESAHAWEYLVDALLASPHYGERWARHWMDIWRYSDWDGYQEELRSSQRHIWRWRDWIIQSLNADKGYDRMLVEMLAGDELAPGNFEVLPATGFLARNYHNSNRDIWLTATVEHASKAFLGITLGCARCHDHKYDPIPQQEYYRFRAIFEPHNVRTEHLPGEPDLLKDGLPVAVDAEPDAETYLYLRGDEKLPVKDNPIAPDVPDALGGALEIEPVALPVESYFPALRPFVREQQLAAAQKQLAEAQTALADAEAHAFARRSSRGDDAASSADITLLRHHRDVARAGVLSLEARQAADCAKHRRDGESPDQAAVDALARNAAEAERRYNVAVASRNVYEKQRALSEVESGSGNEQNNQQQAVDAARSQLAEAEQKLADAVEAAKSSDGEYTPTGTVYPRTSTGRRLALARWITRPDNPLTARVAVNHVWLRHFGSPLVDNVDDFGLRSPRPRHADLLDWLAVELMENDWSLKRLHRLILTSDAWRRSSSGLSAAGEAVAESNRRRDPDNHTFWRMNVRRLEAEIVRDSVLAVAGGLDGALGGPDIPFAKGESTRRRSIYIQHAYEKQMTMLVQFDAASPNECYRRSESIVPQQALALANSTLSAEMSRVLSKRLWSESSEVKTGDPEGAEARFVDRAFRQILARPPSAQESGLCVEFLDQQSGLLADTSQLSTFVGGVESTTPPATDKKQRARENLVLVLINHNDFVTLR